MQDFYNDEKWSKLGFKSLITTRAKSYLIPYFCLSFINLIINSMLEFVKYGLSLSWVNTQIIHIIWVIYGASESARTPNSSPLWFLPCIFVSYVYFYSVSKIKGKELKWLIYSFMTVIFFVVNKIIVNASVQVIYMPWHIDVALIGAVLMHIGYNIKKSRIIINKINLFNVLFITIIGGFSLFINFGNVAMASGKIGEVFSFYISNIAISILILKLSGKIYDFNNYIGRMLVFFGQSSIIAMGFNYLLNTITNVLWKSIPIVKNYEYKWWIKTFVVMMCISTITLLWNKFKEAKI